MRWQASDDRLKRLEVPLFNKLPAVRETYCRVVLAPCSCVALELSFRFHLLQISVNEDKPNVLVATAQGRVMCNLSASGNSGTEEQIQGYPRDAVDEEIHWCPGDATGNIQGLEPLREIYSLHMKKKKRIGLSWRWAYRLKIWRDVSINYNSQNLGDPNSSNIYHFFLRDQKDGSVGEGVCCQDWIFMCLWHGSCVKNRSLSLKGSCSSAF